MAFVNTLINNLSLSLVMSSSGGGAVVIPFLNVYAVLPASVIFTFCYAYASHHLPRDTLFNFVIGVFGALVMGFAFILYPNQHLLHLNTFADQLTQILPGGFAGGIGMIRNWTFTLFYCIAELWGDVGLSLLFWGFANEITHVDSAPFLYPLFGIGANLAQIVGGIVMRLYSSVEFSIAFKSMAIQMIISMGIVIGLHQWIACDARRKETMKRRHVTPLNGTRNLHLLNGRAAPQNGRHGLSFNGTFMGRSNGHVMLVSWRKSSRREKVTSGDKKSFRQSLRTLAESPQIKCLALMTIAQGLSVTLMEFLWKYHLRFKCPTREALAGFLGDVSTATGILTTLLMLMSPILFERLNWKTVANITPRILTWGGIIFFGACMVYQLPAQGIFASVGHWMLQPIVLGGALLFVLSRGSKFSLFKPTEEMVYLSLDEESRTKGKAAVDVVGAQVGKSGGSVVQQVLLMLSGGQLLSILPVMVGSYFYMLDIWRKAISEIALHHHFTERSTDFESIDDDSDVFPSSSESDFQSQNPLDMVPA